MRARPEILFRESAQEACRKVAERVVEILETSPLTPEDTGQYKRHFAVEDTPSGAVIVNRRPDAPKNLWRLLEYGHDIVNKDGEVVGHQAPQPHIRPAVEEVRRSKT